MTVQTLTLIGFGEVGQMLAKDLPNSSFKPKVKVWDVKFCAPDSIPSKAIETVPTYRAPSAAKAATGSDLIISAVTASQTLDAAKSVCGSVKAGAYFLDLNSASPRQKEMASDAIQSAGGKYVEAAIMSPVALEKISSPILLGGPNASSFQLVAESIGLTGTKIYSESLGKVSAAKMCRSIMVKGIEALLSESMLAARHYGVEDTVLNSLADLFPGPDWHELSRYMISRSLEHGLRRAEEMREVARTVAEAGLQPLMSNACAERQNLSSNFASAHSIPGLEDMLDQILGDSEPKRDQSP